MKLCASLKSALGSSSTQHLNPPSGSASGPNALLTAPNFKASQEMSQKYPQTGQTQMDANCGVTYKASGQHIPAQGRSFILHNHPQPSLGRIIDATARRDAGHRCNMNIGTLQSTSYDRFERMGPLHMLPMMLDCVQQSS
jgi:hypothetical protein